MANWVANAKAQAALKGVPIQPGEGRLLVESPWDVVVELRRPDDRVLLVSYDRTRGVWRCS